jgi:predicted enzyme related to lactoylglutathione lyase
MTTQETAMQTNPVGWFEIYVQDMERARQFYENVFLTKLEKLDTGSTEMSMMTFPMEMNHAGAAGALVRMEHIKSGMGGTLVYFKCDDCAVEAGRAKEYGGRVEREKMSIGQYGHIALVYDTEGNMIGLHSMN